MKQLYSVAGQRSKNATYYADLGSTYRQTKQYEKAEKMFLMAHKLEPDNELNVLYLCDMYALDMGKYQKALALYRQFIDETDKVYTKISYYFEMIEVYLLQNGKDMFELIDKVVEEIQKCSLDNQQVKRFILENFSGKADELYEIHRYQEAKKMIAYGLQIDSSNKELQKIKVFM